MEMNTIVIYSPNGLDRECAVVNGELSIVAVHPKQALVEMGWIDKINGSLMDGKYFIPEKVGLPHSAGPGTRYEFVGLKTTDEPADVDTTIRKLANAFERAGKSGWE